MMTTAQSVDEPVWQIPDRLRLVAWLWLDPLPRVEDALLSIAGDAYAHRFVQRLRRHGYLPSDQ